MKCRKCGEENEYGKKYCIYCGESLKTAKSRGLFWIGGIGGIIIVLGLIGFCLWQVRKPEDLQTEDQESGRTVYETDPTEEVDPTEEIASSKETTPKETQLEPETEDNRNGFVRVGDYQVDPNRFYYPKSKSLYCSNGIRYIGTGIQGGFAVIEEEAEIAIKEEGFQIIDCSEFQVYEGYLYYHEPYAAYRSDGALKRIALGSGVEAAESLAENAGKNFFFQGELCYYQTENALPGGDMETVSGVVCLNLETGDCETIGYGIQMPDPDYIISIAGPNALYWDGADLRVRNLQNGDDTPSELLESGWNVLVGSGVCGIEDGVFYMFRDPSEVQRIYDINSLQYDGEYFYCVDVNNSLIRISPENGDMEQLDDQHLFFYCESAVRDEEREKVYLLMDDAYGGSFCSIDMQNENLQIITFFDMAG